MMIIKRNLFLYLVIVVTIMFFGGVVLLVSKVFPRGGYVYSLQNIGLNEYRDVESAFRVKFPAGTSITNVSLVGGKNWTLYARLIIPSDKEEKFISDINFDYEVEPPDGLMLNHPSLSWWKIDQEKLQSILSEKGSGFTQIRFYKPEMNKQTVFMFTDGGRTGFSKELLELFK